MVAANPAAAELLAGSPEAVAGRYLEEFLSDAPSGGLDLMSAGRVSGYETRRNLQRTGQPVQVWVRAVGATAPVTQALAVMLPAGERAAPLLPSVRDGDVPLVLGTTDAALHVERVSSDIEQVFGVTPDEVIGRSVVTLVDQPEAPTMLFAIADATQSGRGVTFRARCPLARDRRDPDWRHRGPALPVHGRAA